MASSTPKLILIQNIYTYIYFTMSKISSKLLTEISIPSSKRIKP